MFKKIIPPLRHAAWGERVMTAPPHQLRHCKCQTPMTG